MKDNQIHEFFDRTTIEEEASRWLIRLDSEESIVADELRELREWINRSPTHGEVLNQLSKVWGKMDVLSELAVPLGRGDAPGWKQPRHVALAAVVLLGVLTLTLFSGPLVTDRDGGGINSGVYATEVGQIRTLNLEDGSVIQLNTDSRLRIDYTSGLRTILLDHGEAHFTVAHDPDRPFVVYSSFGAVRAVGTAFQVRVYANDVEVTVTEGVVELGSLPAGLNLGLTSSNSGGVDQVTRAPRAIRASLGQLSAGQKTHFNGAVKSMGLITELAQSEVAIKLSWREGQLTFAGETLEDVITEINRYTDREVVIIDPEIGGIKIGGRFKVGETEALLEVLQASFNVRVRHVSQGKVELSVAS